MSQKDMEQKDAKSDASYIQLENDKKGAASAAPRSRRCVVASVLSAACVVLIAVSLGFVFPSESGAWSLQWVVRVFSGESAAAPKSTTVRAEGASAQGASHAKSAGSSQAGDNSSKRSDDASKSGSGSQQDSSKDAKQSANNSGKSGHDSSNKNGSSQQHQSSSQGTSNQGGGNNAQSAATGGASGGGNAQQESNQVTVSVSVTSSAVGNPVSAGGTFTFNKGATVYDALCALGVSVNASGTSYGTYVSAIGGLAEKEHGAKSGWMYSVNGSTPMIACSGYKLSNGDKVVWYYVTGD